VDPMHEYTHETEDLSRAIFAYARSRIASPQPLDRIASSEEIANSLLFLCSDESSYIVGTELHCDGGQTVAPMPSVMPPGL